MSESPLSAHCSVSRRRLLAAVPIALLFSVSPVVAGISQAATKLPTVVAIRIWPSDDYTRVTLEHDAPLKFSHFTLSNPDRLVVDIENVEFNSLLGNIEGKISAADPYIKGLRAGRFKPGVVRLVMELKTQVAPQIFNLEPIENYRYRLVLDIYPLNPPDPLQALLKEDTEAVALLPAQRLENPLQDNVSPPPVSPSIAITEEKPTINLSKEPPTSPDAIGTLLANPLTPTAPGASQNAVEALVLRPSKTPIVSRMVTIMLDPGHGGEDPGAVGRAGTREKNVTLQIARRLKKHIDAEPNMRAVLTRDADFFVPLQTRVQKARRIQSDLFISIHADAWVKPDARGSSVFVLSERGASSSLARMMAKKENDADLIGGVNFVQTKDKFLAHTLLDLSQTATINDSLKLGKYVLGELEGVNTLHKAHVEQAGFAVLKAPDIPSILVETAFISNPEEESRLKDERYQEKMAAALIRAIRQYFVKNPPSPKSKLAALF